MMVILNVDQYIACDIIVWFLVLLGVSSLPDNRLL